MFYYKKEEELTTSVFQTILTSTFESIGLPVFTQASMELNTSIHLLDHMTTMYHVLFAMPPQELLN